MKADRKSEDAQKDDSDRERMGTEIKDKKKGDTQAEGPGQLVSILLFCF